VGNGNAKNKEKHSILSFFFSKKKRRRAETLRSRNNQLSIHLFLLFVLAFSVMAALPDGVDAASLAGVDAFFACVRAFRDDEEKLFQVLEAANAATLNVRPC
jgi:hypothetical protein